MRKYAAAIVSVIAALSLAGCGNSQNSQQSTSASAATTAALAETRQTETQTETRTTAKAEDGGILIAYFSVMETDGVDTVAGASRVAVDGEALGNCQYIARLIEQSTGGDLFAIETVQEYPGTHEPLLDFAWDEKAQNARPELATHIDNLEDYNIIFLGYPIWWSEMPMAMYSFFDAHDFSGKTIIPSSSHGGSGFSGTPAEIRRLEPGANVQDGYTVSRGQVAGDEANLRNWIGSLNLQ